MERNKKVHLLTSADLNYIFVAGLEHSGTTLLAQLLSAGDSTLALGEVGQFLSRAHLEEYLAAWGDYPDVTRCSCGNEWAECPIWQRRMSLCGRFENHELAQGYEALIGPFIGQTDWSVLVDSSKSFQYLEALRKAWTRLDQPASRRLTVVVAKDPRGFADSIGRKTNSRQGVVPSYRAMNWWCSVYQRLLTYLSESPRHIVVTYRSLCKNPGLVLKLIANALDIEHCQPPKIDHYNSHIALGNKDLTERNRNSIRYDDRWTNNTGIAVAYRCNWRAQRIYGRLRMIEQAQFSKLAT